MNTFREVLTSEKLQYILVAFGLYWAWVAATIVLTIAVLWTIISSFWRLNVQIFKMDKLFFNGSAMITKWVRGILKGSGMSRSTSASLAGTTITLPQDTGVNSRKKKGVSRRSKANTQVSSSTGSIKDEKASV